MKWEGVSVTTPCHHPKWPRRCHECRDACLGSGFSVPFIRSAPESNEGHCDFETRWHIGQKQIGVDGAYCEKCNTLFLYRGNWILNLEDIAEIEKQIHDSYYYFDRGFKIQWLDSTFAMDFPDEQRNH